MIQTVYVPAVPQQIERDGKKIIALAPPPIVLMQSGPVIPLRIAKPPETGDATMPTPPSESVDVHGVIDTGAFTSVITPEIAKQLGLIQTGWQEVSSVHSKEDRPVYFAMLWLPWGSAYPTKVVACNLGGNVKCLIGRDILSHLSITYNGKEGFFTICE